MAYRRKYKTGGRVPVDPATGLPLDLASAEVTLPPEEATADTTADVADDAIMCAIQGTQRAEQMQRAAAVQQQQAQQPKSVEEVIDRLPVSDRRKAFLKQNQLLLDPRNARAIEFYYRQSQDVGHAPDSDAEDQHILRGVLAEIEAERRRGIAAANQAVNAMQSPPQAERNDDQEAMRLEHEAEAVRDVLQAGAAVPTALASEIEPAPSPRSARGPVVAPVVREVPTASGQRSNFNKITLSGEQRDMARRSMPWLSPEEAERTYALNLQRMLRLKAEGAIE
jgi:hypothetical protein